MATSAGNPSRAAELQRTVEEQQHQIQALKETLDEVKREKETTKEEMQRLSETLANAREEYETHMRGLGEEHAAEIEDLKKRITDAAAELRAEQQRNEKLVHESSQKLAEQKDRLNEEHRRALSALRSSHASEVKAMAAKFAKEQTRLRNKWHGHFSERLKASRAEMEAELAARVKKLEAEEASIVERQATLQERIDAAIAAKKEAADAAEGARKELASRSEDLQSEFRETEASLRESVSKEMEQLKAQRAEVLRQQADARAAKEKYEELEAELKQKFQSEVTQKAEAAVKEHKTKLQAEVDAIRESAKEEAQKLAKEQETRMQEMEAGHGKQLRIMERDFQKQVDDLKMELESAQEALKRGMEAKQSLTDSVKAEAAEMRRKHEEEVAAAQEKHEAALRELDAKYAAAAQAQEAAEKKPEPKHEEHEETEDGKIPNTKEEVDEFIQEGKEQLEQMMKDKASKEEFDAVFHAFESGLDQILQMQPEGSPLHNYVLNGFNVVENMRKYVDMTQQWERDFQGRVQRMQHLILTMGSFAIMDNLGMPIRDEDAAHVQEELEGMQSDLKHEDADGRRKAILAVQSMMGSVLRNVSTVSSICYLARAHVQRSADPVQEVREFVDANQEGMDEAEREKVMRVVQDVHDAILGTPPSDTGVMMAALRTYQNFTTFLFEVAMGTLTHDMRNMQYIEMVRMLPAMHQILYRATLAVQDMDILYATWWEESGFQLSALKILPTSNSQSGIAAHTQRIVRHWIESGPKGNAEPPPPVKWEHMIESPPLEDVLTFAREACMAHVCTMLFLPSQDIHHISEDLVAAYRSAIRSLPSDDEAGKFLKSQARTLFQPSMTEASAKDVLDFLQDYALEPSVSENTETMLHGVFWYTASFLTTISGMEEEHEKVSALQSRYGKLDFVYS